MNADRVRSSVARHLGIPTEGLPEPDHYTEGVVQVMIDAVRNYSEERPNSVCSIGMPLCSPRGVAVFIR